VGSVIAFDQQRDALISVEMARPAHRFVE